MLHFIRRNCRWLAAGFLLSLFSSFGQTFFIGLSGSAFQSKFDLSAGEFGFLYMAATLASAATLPWLGRTLDVVRGGKVAALVMPGLAFACLLIAWSPYLAGFILALYFLRLLGQGMMTHIAQVETARSFVANRGRAMSLIIPGHQAGEAVLPATFVLLSAAMGWQGAWTAAAALILLVGLPLVTLLLSRPRSPEHMDRQIEAGPISRQWTLGEVARDPAFYLMLAGALVPSFVGTSIFFHQDHLIAVRGYDKLAFAAAFPVMAASTVIFGLVSGHLIDRFGAARLAPFFLVPMFVASVAAAAITAVWGVYAFMLLFGISYGLTSNLLGVIWAEVYGTSHLGAIRSVVVSAMVFSTALGPGVTGAFIDMGVNLPEQMWWMAAWCVVASLALLIAGRRFRDRALVTADQSS